MSAISEDYCDFAPAPDELGQGAVPEQVGEQEGQEGQEEESYEDSDSSESEEEDFGLTRGKSDNSRCLLPHELNSSPLNRYVVTEPLSHTIQTSIRTMEGGKGEDKRKDKSQRATVELVLDPRTRLLLLKMVQRRLVDKVNGCVSTGKEANVYHAEKGEQEFAVKIFKTSILVFKDRERYVEGEFRFRRGHCSSNPRKMVKMWAEKELRNLKRIQGKVPSPQPVEVKNNIIVMEFLGKDMRAAPRLHEAGLGPEEAAEGYRQTLDMMRVLFQDCKLVHADLSEYNLLYWQNRVYMIDMSHAVEHDHLYSLQFLRRDIRNVSNFFRRKTPVLSARKAFHFITAQEKADLEQLLAQHDDENDEEDDVVFEQSFIPRSLDQLTLEEIERDIGRKQRHYGVLTGAVEQQAEDDDEDEEDDEDEDQDEDDGDQDNKEQGNQGEGAEGEGAEKGQKERREKIGGKQKYEGLSKQQRKTKVKEEKRERRKDKMPKHVKKALTKKK